MKPERVQPGSPDYPPALLRGGASSPPPFIHAIGNAAHDRRTLNRFEQKATKETKRQKSFVSLCKLPVLAKHYGFTDEELDFILNYDIKYRLGLDGSEEEHG
jgi:hypothetical protein